MSLGFAMRGQARATLETDVPPPGRAWTATGGEARAARHGTPMAGDVR
jgi:hypothetical protein